MAVTRFDFIKIAKNYGIDEVDAISDYDFMASTLMFDLTKMTSKDLEEYYQHRARLDIALDDDKN